MIKSERYAIHARDRGLDAARVANIAFDYLERGAGLGEGEILSPPAAEVVEHPHLVTLDEKPLDEMGPDEASAARD